MQRTTFVLQLLLACGSHAPPPPVQVGPRPPAIAGVVTDKDTGRELSGVTVTVAAPDNTSISQLTSDCGDYAIDDLPAGDYTVNFYYGDGAAQARVHVTSDRTARLDEALSVTPPGTTPIRIVGGPACHGVTTAPTPPPQSMPPPTPVRQHASSGIEGVITDARSHEPVAGATVTATAANVAVSQLSDENGAYVFPDLAPGTYTITFFYGNVHDQVTEVLVEAGRATVVDDALDQTRTGIITRWQPPAHP